MDRGAEPEISPDVLKQAMIAFKKRLKLTKLDAESGISRGPLSGGKRSGIVAIRPPNAFPQHVWDKLVETGKLRKIEGGLYELGGDPRMA